MSKAKLFAVLKISTAEYMHPEDMRPNRKVIFEALGYSCQKEASEYSIPIFPGLIIKVEVMPNRDESFEIENQIDPDRAFDQGETLVLQNLEPDTGDDMDPDSGTMYLNPGEWDEIIVII